MAEREAKTKHVLARRAREARLRRLTEVFIACSCEYPLVTYRNGHGHGKTADGAPCPAIAVLERHDEEREALAAEAEVF